ncbi:MAG TPA: universal stress protein [Dehalococcoidia bacterium]|nr:universal stress protein [Dehalococcoidia bacterium]
MPGLTILVPLDGSKAAELSLSFLAALKPLGIGQVRLLSVVEPAASPEVEEERVRNAREYLATLAERTERLHGVPTEPVCRTGVAAAEIMEEAERPEVNLVLMTTLGAGAVRDRLGGVADKVARGALCPTLLLGPHASAPLEIRTITVPLDGSRLAAEVLPVARAFAEKLNSRIRLVSVLQQVVGLEPEVVGAVAAEVIESIDLTGSLYLEEAKLELGTSQPVETVILEGPPADALLRDLKENPPQLVMMTSHGRHGFVRWALGSVTDRLILGPAPVLVLRPVDAGGERLRGLTEREP